MKSLLFFLIFFPLFSMGQATDSFQRPLPVPYPQPEMQKVGSAYQLEWDSTFGCDSLGKKDVGFDVYKRYYTHDSVGRLTGKLVYTWKPTMRYDSNKSWKYDSIGRMVHYTELWWDTAGSKWRNNKNIIYDYKKYSTFKLITQPDPRKGSDSEIVKIYYSATFQDTMEINIRHYIDWYNVSKTNFWYDSNGNDTITLYLPWSSNTFKYDRYNSRLYRDSFSQNLIRKEFSYSWNTNNNTYYKKPDTKEFYFYNSNNLLTKDSNGPGLAYYDSKYYFYNSLGKIKYFIYRNFYRDNTGALYYIITKSNRDSYDSIGNISTMIIYDTFNLYDGFAATYYRTDFHYKKLVITQVLDLPLKSKIKAYPNPVKDELHLDIEGFVGGKINLTLGTILGREISRRQFDNYDTFNHLTLNLADLPRGVYLLKVEQNGKQYITKIIK
jgi:hypothetical protein